MTVAARDQLDTVLQLADARREDLLGFVQEFLRERSPAPKIGTVDVASTQRWLAQRLTDLGCFHEVERASKVFAALMPRQRRIRGHAMSVAAISVIDCHD